MNVRKKLDKLCKEQLHSGVKTYDEALDFLREFTCVYDKCKSDKEYVPGLSHYDFMYWVNPIREAFAENDYIKAVEKLIDTYMEQNAYLYQSRVKNSIMILLRQYVKPRSSSRDRSLSRVGAFQSRSSRAARSLVRAGYSGTAHMLISAPVKCQSPEAMP